LVRREEVAEAPADAFGRLIAEGVGSGGVDREDSGGEIVRADQGEGGFDQLTVSPPAVAQGVGRLLPCGGNGFERRRALLLSHCPCRGVALYRTVWRDHERCEGRHAGARRVIRAAGLPTPRSASSSMRRRDCARTAPAIGWRCSSQA